MGIVKRARLIHYIYPFGRLIHYTLIVENKEKYRYLTKKATNCKGYLWFKDSNVDDKEYNKYTKGKTPLFWEDAQDYTNEIAPNSHGILQVLRIENNTCIFRQKEKEVPEIHYTRAFQKKVDVRIEITSNEKTIHRWLRDVNLPQQIRNKNLPEFTINCQQRDERK